MLTLNSRKREDGFTLIELLVVIIIIGILAAIAIPLFLDQRKLAVDAAVKSDVRNTVTAITTATAIDGSTRPTTVPVRQTAALGANEVVQIATDPNDSTSYVVFGYDTDGKNLTRATKAFTYHANTGLFTTEDMSAVGARPTTTGYDAANDVYNQMLTNVQSYVGINTMTGTDGAQYSAMTLGTSGGPSTQADQALVFKAGSLAAIPVNTNLPSHTATCDASAAAAGTPTITNFQDAISNVKLYDANNQQLTYTPVAAAAPVLNTYINCGGKTPTGTANPFLSQTVQLPYTNTTYSANTYNNLDHVTFTYKGQTITIGRS